MQLVIIGTCLAVVAFASVVVIIYREKSRRCKVERDWEMSSDYSQENQDNGNGNGKEMVLNNSSRHNVDGNDLAPQANKEGRHIAVVRPHIESNSKDCKEVENLDDILQHRTRESFQVAGDSENTQAVNAAENSENKHQNNQLCQRTKNESLSPRDLVAPEFEIDWTRIFLQLSRSFSPTRWKLFAYQLLSNCQEMARSVHDTVDEIELEANHTEGWVIHAYIKVFNKWLDNVGRANATFGHIKDAVSASIDSKEALDQILSIERNPPMKIKEQRYAAVVPRKFEQTISSNSSFQHFMALHNDEEPGNSNCGRELYIRSSETKRFQLAHCPYCSLYTKNEISDRQETLTSVQSNESYREQNKKRKKDQSQTQQPKRRITEKYEKYIIENAKQNLHLEFMPIRQNDYDMYMNFVIACIANECQVAERTVWSVTQAGFCEAQEVIKEKGTMFVINDERINLCLRKETFEELTFYGNIARPKLLKYLKERNPEYDSTTSETFMFINFNGIPLFEHMEDKDDQSQSYIATQEKDTKQRFKLNSPTGSSIKTSLYMKESDENIDDYKPRRKQNSSDQSTESEQINRCFRKTSTFDTHEYKPIEEEEEGTSKSATNHEKEKSNKAEDGQEIVKSQMNDIKKKEIESSEVDMETETQSITQSFFHKFCEIS
ncbi:uncharacterized protein LOC132734940 [Ruditapes philippinarum]|uniref:uncharacterized protein LOC132734940 n=1 Tax=Ruditapes philippinarum TaxID=129788 RepID=UPI00295C126C|nr:uncharacterized protein LOC132734940 [Ruditapes philippinarum]